MFHFHLLTILLFIIVISQESLCLTMRALQNLPTNDDPHFYFPEEDDTVSGRGKTFVRTIGSVAGREIVPRRWTNEQRRPTAVVDEDGIVIPPKRNPLLSRILGRPGGI